MKNCSFVHKRLFFILFLSLVWVLAALIVNPIGNFPLNDDFSFGRSVYNLSEHGILKFDDWLSMTLIAHVFLGASFCKIFGFSFTALRFSTLLLGYFGVVACYYIAKDFDKGRFAPFLAAMVMAFNPLYFSLSYTFMTDVLFISLLSFSLLFYLKYFRDEDLKWLLMANAFALAAIFIRQLGLLLPLAFALTWLLTKKWDARHLIVATLPLAVSLLLYLGYMKWFEATQGMPETFGTISKLFKRLGDDGFLIVCINRVGLLLIYMGLFFLPLNLLVFKWIKKRRFVLFTIGIVAVGLVAMFSIWEMFPNGNILYNLGLGPKALKDGIFFINVKPKLPIWAMRGIALSGIFGAILLIANLVNKFHQKREWKSHENLTFLFVSICILIYVGFLMLDVHFFDRYFLPLIPFGIILLLPYKQDNRHPALTNGKNISHILSFTFLVLLATFSITATHDYLSWNRARWRALDHLTSNLNISPSHIDGGFEFNGWHRPVKERTFGTSKSWWWVDREDYLVTFGDLGGFHKIKSYPFKTYLPPAIDSIFILKKN